MIQMENVCFEYKVHTPVLNGINAQIYKGDVVGILGHNGAGKTTLFRILLDLFKPSEGVVKVDAMKRELGYVPEEAGIYLNLSAMQNISCHSLLKRWKANMTSTSGKLRCNNVFCNFVGLFFCFDLY